MKTSIILPVIDETFSLEQTVEILVKENEKDIYEIIVVTSSSKTTPASLKIVNQIQAKYPRLVKQHRQTLPFLGGALREALEIAEGSHTVLMASDLETDPHTVKKLIEAAKDGHDIVVCTRWAGGQNFLHYNKIKLVLNKIFQLIFRLLYRTNLTDLTFAFRIYKTEILKKIKWEELRHPFLFECIIKPLKLGYNIKEIPSMWNARKEGRSQNTFFRNFVYFRIGIKTLFTKKEKLIK